MTALVASRRGVPAVGCYVGKPLVDRCHRLCWDHVAIAHDKRGGAYAGRHVARAAAEFVTRPSARESSIVGIEDLTGGLDQLRLY